MTHNELASSLAAHLRGKRCDFRVAWENLGFSEWGPTREDSLNCRPDVFSIRPTLDVTKCQPWTHEVKISRADFLSDIRSGKWKQYQQISCRVFFAAPKGLIDPSELPDGPGLWEHDPAREGGQRWGFWSLMKPAKFCKGWDLPPRHLMKLILGRWGTYASQLPDSLKQAPNLSAHGALAIEAS